MKIWIVIGLVALALLACETEGERISDANRDASRSSSSSSSSSSSPASSSISVFDLRIGDCFTAAEREPSRVRRVSCGSYHTDEVVGSFTVSFSSFPVLDSAFDNEALLKCPVQANSFLQPTRESWNAGDRTVLCLVSS